MTQTQEMQETRGAEPGPSRRRLKIAALSVGAASVLTATGVASWIAVGGGDVIRVEVASPWMGRHESGGSATPAPKAGVSDAEKAAAFARILDQHGVPHEPSDDLVTLGHIACRELDRGHTPEVVAMEVSGGLIHTMVAPLHDWSWSRGRDVVDGAVEVFCPLHAAPK